MFRHIRIFVLLAVLFPLVSQAALDRLAEEHQSDESEITGTEESSRYINQAIVIGPKEYVINPLPNAKNDVDVIKSLLTLRGVATLELEDVDVDKIADAAKDTENVLLHFSGHAYCDQTGANLITTSTTSENLEESSVHINQVLEALGPDTEDHVVVFLDSSLIDIADKQSCSPLTGISRILNTTVLFATLPNQVANEVSQTNGDSMGLLSATVANVISQNPEALNISELVVKVLESIKLFEPQAEGQMPWVMDVQLGSPVIPAAKFSSILNANPESDFSGSTR